MIDLTVTVTRRWTAQLPTGYGGLRPVDQQELVITCQSYRSTVIVCTCTRGLKIAYEPRTKLGPDSDSRLNLARCQSGHLHRRQVDELIKRLVASFGGPRKVKTTIVGGKSDG